MDNKPQTIVGDVAVHKPRVVIIDDRANLLSLFKNKYEQLGCDVVAIYVSDGQFDGIMQDGKLKRGINVAAQPETYHDEKHDHAPAPERTLDMAIAEAQEKVNNGHRRYGQELAMLQALTSFDYAVKSRDELERVLNELDPAPDAILTDYEMRKESSMTSKHIAKKDELMGTDVMELAETLYPNVPRAMHTSLFTFADERDRAAFNENPENVQEFEAVQAHAQQHGYLLSGKDRTAELTPYSDAIHAYFQNALPVDKRPRVEAVATQITA